jgi:hypothetical protein
MLLFGSGVNVQTGEEVALKLVSEVIDFYWVLRNVDFSTGA